MNVVKLKLKSTKVTKLIKVEGNRRSAKTKAERRNPEWVVLKVN